jgi:capsular polysaccharide biosynthesis protein
MKQQILNQGKLHWFKNVYYYDKQFYCSTIKGEHIVPSTLDSQILINHDIVWDVQNKKYIPNKKTKEINFKKIKSAFVHKRHTSSGYSHILGDECLPIYYLLKSNNVQVDGLLTIPNTKRNFSFHKTFKSTLELLTNETVIDENENYFIENLYCGWQTNSWTALDFNFDFSQYARDICSPLNIHTPEDPQDIVFVVRENDERRSILNMQEIKNTFNFKYVDFAKCSLEEQISICRNCKCLIAQHGAGLANISFLQPDTQVIEILPEALRDYGGYKMFADMFRVQYSSIIVPNENCQPHFDKDDLASKRDQDLNVDINLIKSKIK